MSCSISRSQINKSINSANNTVICGEILGANNDLCTRTLLLRCTPLQSEFLCKVLFFWKRPPDLAVIGWIVERGGGQIVWTVTIQICENLIITISHYMLSPTWHWLPPPHLDDQIGASTFATLNPRS